MGEPVPRTAADHDEDCDPQTFGVRDLDGDDEPDVECCNAASDGTTYCGSDCDDSRAGVSPTATETCNGRDDDCNGLTDEDTMFSLYEDADLDGDGSSDPSAPTTLACRPSAGWSLTNTDCDDAEPGVRLGAIEQCDLAMIDEDCDGQANEDCDCSIGADPEPCSELGACASGTRTCIDGSWSGCSIRAVAETCYDADDDCDGSVDEGVRVSCYPDADNDGYSPSGALPSEMCPVDGRASVGGCPVWVTWGSGYETPPLRNLWEAFDQGRAVLPLDPSAGPGDWYRLDGRGSQNHALLWLGVAALGAALADDVAQYEIAAANCLRLLELDHVQGHMRHEAVGSYAGYWERGIAAMALAGSYAPAGSRSGSALLAAARAWWNDHIAVLRRLSMPDGQVALIGARANGGGTDTEDVFAGLSAAVNLQLLDPRPYDDLHPYIRSLLTRDGRPAPRSESIPARWDRPRHVAERWVVLRAIQSGALLPVPVGQPAPPLVQRVHRWTSDSRVIVAAPSVYGYRPSRFQASWAPGQVVRVDVGDGQDVPSGGKGPHTASPPLSIPPGAELILGAP